MHVRMVAQRDFVTLHTVQCRGGKELPGFARSSRKPSSPPQQVTEESAKTPSLHPGPIGDQGIPRTTQRREMRIGPLVGGDPGQLLLELAGDRKPRGRHGKVRGTEEHHVSDSIEPGLSLESVYPARCTEHQTTRSVADQ